MADVETSPEREAAEIAKLAAETQASLATAEHERAQARKENRLAQVAALQIEQTGYAVAHDRIYVDAYRLDWERTRAADRYHHIYRFDGEVGSASVKNAISELSIWDRLDPGCDMEVIFNSPGGSVIDGNALFDFIRELRSKDHFVTTVAYGYAASMGGILLQAGSRRVMGKEAVVLIHQIASLCMGKIGEIEDEVGLIHMLQDRVLGTFADRSREAFANGTSEVALTREDFEKGNAGLGIKGWERRDWWLTSDECLRFGIVDEVR